MSQPKLTERELLIRISQGDEDAFSQLFYAWNNQLATYIFKIIRSEQLTEEIIQDVFLKIWMCREILVDIKNFESWLFVITRNQTISLLRKQVKEKAFFKDYIYLSDEQHNLEDDLLNKEKIFSLLDEAIEQLPAQQQKVFILSRKKLLKQQHIADNLQISLPTVKSHLQAALKNISSFLNEKMRSELLILLALMAF